MGKCASKNQRLHIREIDERSYLAILDGIDYYRKYGVSWRKTLNFYCIDGSRTRNILNLVLAHAQMHEETLRAVERIWSLGDVFINFHPCTTFPFPSSTIPHRVLCVSDEEVAWKSQFCAVKIRNSKVKIAKLWTRTDTARDYRKFCHNQLEIEWKIRILKRLRLARGKSSAVKLFLNGQIVHGITKLSIHKSIE